MNKKVAGLFRDELIGNLIIEFVALRPKIYSYLTDDDTAHKKLRKQKVCNKKNT